MCLTVFLFVFVIGEEISIGSLPLVRCRITASSWARLAEREDRKPIPPVFAAF